MSSEPSPNSASTRNGVAITALVVITLIGLGLRWLNVTESLWLDELHTSWVVSGTWDDVGPREQIGNQNPAWFLLEKAIIELGGQSELTLRLTSLIAGVALIPGVYAFIRRGGETSDYAGPLLAAILIALHPVCIFYATEARPYACMQALALAQLYCFVVLLDKPTAFHGLAYLFLSALLVHLHLTAGLMLLGEIAVLLLLGLKEPWRWRFTGGWIVAFVFLGLLLLPLLAQAGNVFARRHLWREMAETSLLELLLFTMPINAPLLAILLVALERMWLTHCRLPSATFDSADQVVLRRTLNLAVWFFAPVLLAWLVSRLDLAGIFLGRYLVLFAVAPVLLASVILSLIRNGPLRWLAALLILSMSGADNAIIHEIAHTGRAVGDRTEDWRAAAKFLTMELRPSDELWLQSGLIEERDYVELGARREQLTDLQVQYLMFPVLGLYRTPVEWQQLHLLRLEDFPEHPHARCFFLMRGSRQPHPQAQEVQRFGSLHVWQYDATTERVEK